MKNYDFDEMISRIKQLKKAAKLTNEELSENANVPLGTLNKILGSETKKPQIQSMLGIAEALGVTADYIVYGEESQPQTANPLHQTLLDHFNQLNDAGQQHVLDTAEMAAQMPKYKKKSDEFDKKGQESQAM